MARLRLMFLLRTIQVKSGEFTVKITAYDKYGNSSAKTIKASIKPAASVTLDKASLTLDKGKKQCYFCKNGWWKRSDGLCFLEVF